MNKINNKCRTCLSESNKGMQSLTKMVTDESTEQKSFAELLKEVAKINIYSDNCLQLPQAICGCCTRKLRAAHAFVKQAQEVNEKLFSMLKEIDDTNKLCLQEIQIDVKSCAEIKIEGDSVYEQVNDVEVLGEVEFIKRSIKFKQEDTEEDTLAVSCSPIEGNLDDSKSLIDFLDVSYPNISVMTEMPDNKNTISKNIQQTEDTSDSSIIYKSSDSAVSNDDEDWQYNSKRSCIKSSKEKVKSSKTSKSAVCEKVKANNTNNKDDEVKCNDCDKIFNNAQLLTQHQRRNHVPEELKIQCQDCDAKFSRRHNMYAHMRRIHKTQNLQEIQLQIKKQNSEKKFPCEQCPRSYTNKYKLVAHINSHHNQDNMGNPPKEKILQPKKRFLCTLCGLKFDSTGHLNIHFRCHTGEKPFKCEFCDRAYPRLYDVTVHRRTHTGEKPYQCTLCEKTFRNSNKLKVHMRTHTNERPYKCTQCEKAFKQSKDLNIHKRTHTGERPYKCGVCLSTFTQSNSLRLHQIKQQHLEKPNVTENVPGVGTTTFPLCHLKLF